MVEGSDMPTGSMFDQGRRFERKACAEELKHFIQVIQSHVNLGMVDWLNREANRMKEGAPLFTYGELVGCSPHGRIWRHLQEVD